MLALRAGPPRCRSSAHATGVIRNMNSEEYKKICNAADVLPKNILIETQSVLVNGSVREASVVKIALLKGAIPFPDNHNGDSSVTYHKVKCLSEEAESIADYLFEREAESVPVSGITTPETSKLVTLVNVWHELADYIQENV